MALRNIKAFQNEFDIEIQRAGKDKLAITIVKGKVKKRYLVKEGSTKKIQF